MRYIVLALVLCFALSPVSAAAAKKPAKIVVKHGKVKHVKPKKVKPHPRAAH